jgi:hypothetical protein
MERRGGVRRNGELISVFENWKGIFILGAPRGNFKTYTIRERRKKR